MANIYISKSGSDSNGGTLQEDPFLTAQHAFNYAYLNPGAWVLNFGPGTFEGINLNDPDLIDGYITNNLGTTILIQSNGLTGTGSLLSGAIYVTDGSIGGSINGSYDGGWILSSDSGDPYNNIQATGDPGLPWISNSRNGIGGYTYLLGADVSIGWPSRIQIVGAGYNQTFLGGVFGNGTNSSTVPDGSIFYPNSITGQTISITSNSTINLGAIWSNGGYDYSCQNYNPAGGSGGTISLTGCYFQQIHCDGNSSNCSSSSASGSSNGGTVTLVNCHCTDTYGVSCNGSNPGGKGGTITATNCQLYSLQCNTESTCSDAGNAQPGGTITLNSSSATYIDANGGSSNSGSGGNGGTVTLNNSTVSNNINANGGSHCGYYTTGGSPGSVILQNGSTVSGSINTYYGSPQDYGCGLGNDVSGLIPDPSKVVSGVTYTAGAITYTGKLAASTTDNSQKNKLFLSAALGVPIP